MRIRLKVLRTLLPSPILVGILTLTCQPGSLQAANPWDRLDVSLGAQHNSQISGYRPFTASAAASKQLGRYLCLPLHLALQRGQNAGFRQSSLSADIGVGFRLPVTEGWDLKLALGPWWRRQFMSPAWASGWQFTQSGGWARLGSHYRHRHGWEAEFTTTLHHNIRERAELTVTTGGVYPLTPRLGLRARFIWQPRNESFSDQSLGGEAGLRYLFGG